MEINSFTNGTPPPPPQQSLTEEQKNTLNSIVSQYDGDDFSESDFNAMNAQLKEAGLRPSAELKSALEEQGIDVSSFVQEKKGPPPPPPPPVDEEKVNLQRLGEVLQSNEAVASAFQELIADSEDGTLDDDDLTSLASILEDNGVSTSGIFLDELA